MSWYSIQGEQIVCDFTQAPVGMAVRGGGTIEICPKCKQPGEMRAKGSKRRQCIHHGRSKVTKGGKHTFVATVACVWEPSREARR